MPHEKPVFIVGIFRSGTSLLCSLLNQNPGVALMYESDVWNFPRPLLNYRFRKNWAERIEFYNQALSRHRMVSGKTRALLKGIRTPTDLYRTFGARKGALVCGEKSPFYCSRLEQLYQRYPGASFILVWRSPVEVYRSVLKAGQTSRFFGKPGMLSRLIYHQEQLIQQAARIEAAGARIYRVNYAGLVDHPEMVCREICDFLRVPFDARMLRLDQADLSTIYRAPHHAYLRRGVIERQKYSEALVSPAIAQKLDRYRHRWEQLQVKWLKLPATSTQTGPGRFEFAWHHVVGWCLTQYDSLVRAGFEFMPLAWLRIYRLLKDWILNRPSADPDEKISVRKELSEHWLTLLTAAALVGAVAWVHLHANPHLFFILFYGLPCALVALVVNTRWATLFVLACSILSPAIQFDGDPVYRSPLVFVWNSLSRFLLLETLVMLLGRIRLDFKREENAENDDTAANQTPLLPVPSMKFSIITPSFRNSAWLKLCIASVADQQGVAVEHIVQDACSDDGTQDWLPKDPRVQAFIEKDAGMYDAVNRGYRRATGDILAYLNCDEQYLPGALATVRKYFEEHPETEVLLAGSIVTDGDGNYICHRHSLTPNRHHVWFRFPILTSAIFIRRSVIHKRGLYFDTQWRDLGDFHWVLHLMQQGVSFAVSDVFTSVFADTGDNMNLKPNAIREKAATKAMTPAWVRVLKPLWILHHRLRRLARGHFRLQPTSYAIYTKASPDRRVTIDVPRPTAIWWNRM